MELSWPATVPSIRPTFLALVVLQVAHSIEEYIGRLWESFPPAMFLTGLVSADRETGFIILNAALILFGIWCVAVPVRLGWAAAPALMWFWVVIQTINGVVHPMWSAAQHSYTPGVITAPLLLGTALMLAFRLGRRSPSTSTAA